MNAACSFFLSPCHVVSSVLNMCVECDIQLFCILIIELFHRVCTPIIIILCEVIVDLSSVVASVKVYHVLLSMLCCVLYHVS